MTKQDQRIALCEWAGWKRVEVSSGLAWGSDADKNKCWIYVHQLPDTNSLDVLHEMEKRILGNDSLFNGDESVSEHYFNSISKHATASQRREALLRTLGLWRD